MKRTTQRRFGRIDAGKGREPGDKNPMALAQSRGEKLCCFLRSTNVQPEAEYVEIFHPEVDLGKPDEAEAFIHRAGGLHEPRPSAAKSSGRAWRMLQPDADEPTM